MKPSIKALLDFLFSGTTLRRWNGFIHPIELTEVDRQGHKMMIAWFLYMLEKPSYSLEEAHNIYYELIEGAFFTYCLNLVITDIKPSIYEQISKNQEHHKAIITWAMEQCTPLLNSISLSHAERALSYLLTPSDETQSQAREILKAASLYSRLWEYQLLRGANTFLHSDTTIFETLLEDIEKQCERLPSFKKILPSFSTSLPIYTTILRKIACSCGSLRLQRRWSQIIRLPETNVLGHTFLVSIYTYIFSTLIESCPSRTANTFFGALFHDLPELVTQDIVNPVKHSSQSVARIIQEYEHQEMETSIIKPLQEEEPLIAQELQYLLGYDIGSEFYNTIIEHGEIKRLSFHELHYQYNQAQYTPKDGSLIKLCDTISALIEAHTSIMQGVRSKALIQARERILNVISQYTLHKEQDFYFSKIITDTIQALLAEIQNEIQDNS